MVFSRGSTVRISAGAKVVMEDGRELLNMCANNYLGLGDNQRLIDAAKKLMMKKDMGLLLSDLSVEHRTSTKNWKRRFPDSGNR